MNTDPKTVGELIRETTVVVGQTKLTVNTVLLDAASSSYDTTIYDDTEGKQHHGMRLGHEWIIGRGQQMGTRSAALALHEDAVKAARTHEPQALDEGAVTLYDIETRSVWRRMSATEGEQEIQTCYGLGDVVQEYETADRDGNPLRVVLQIDAQRDRAEPDRGGVYEFRH